MNPITTAAEYASSIYPRFGMPPQADMDQHSRQRAFVRGAEWAIERPASPPADPAQAVERAEDIIYPLLGSGASVAVKAHRIAQALAAAGLLWGDRGE